MTRDSGGDTDNRSPAPGPERDPVGEVGRDAREKGPDLSPGETSDPDDCTAHDRAS
jgi:hypothetical protein